MATEVMREVSRSDSTPLPLAGRLKRVLYVLNLSPGGRFPSLAEQALVLAREFRDRGSVFLPVYVPPCDPDFAKIHAEEGIRVEWLDLRKFSWATFCELVRIIRKNRIEIVHWNFYNPLINGYVWALTVFTPWARHFYTDHISRPSEDGAAGKGAALRMALKWPLTFRYQKTLCISEFVEAELRKHHWPNREIAYNFINTERFHPDTESRRTVRASSGVGDEFIVLAVAYLIKEKGVDVAVLAMAALPDDVILWVVGDGPERENLAALARNLNLDRRVRFLGSHRNIVPFLQAADCFVCPSMWKEGAGNANFEAMACGLPDLASRIGGIPEFIEDGRNGFLFTPGDHSELARQIRRLQEDRDLHRRMGAEARSIVIERYSTQTLLSGHLRLYQ